MTKVLKISLNPHWTILIFFLNAYAQVFLSVDKGTIRCYNDNLMDEFKPQIVTTMGQAKVGRSPKGEQALWIRVCRFFTD